MKCQSYAAQIILENGQSQDVLSSEDIEKIVSEARRNRSVALAENIKNCMNPFKDREPTIDFSLVRER